MLWMMPKSEGGARRNIMRTQRLQVENCKLQIAKCRRGRQCGFAARDLPFAVCDSFSNKRGFTLFEVLLSLAIFAVSLVAIGQMMSNGMRGAVQARLQSQAVLRCQSKLAEVVAGVAPLQAANNVAFPDDADWHWSMTVTPATQANLYVADLTVARKGSNAVGDVSFTLRRMLRDPQLATNAVLEEASMSSTTSSTTSTSSSSSSSSSSSGAGS